MSPVQRALPSRARHPTPNGIRRPLLLLMAAVLPILSLFSATACEPDTLTLEERAQAIDQRLMCPVCPAETIDQSQADVALQMRELVREKLRAGETEDQIYDFFVERYDKGVLAEPPAEGFNILVWVIPPVALVLGLTLLWIGIRHMGRSDPRRLSSHGDWEAESERYLREVNEEFESFRRTSGAARTSGHGQ